MCEALVRPRSATLSKPAAKPEPTPCSGSCPRSIAQPPDLPQTNSPVFQVQTEKGLFPPFFVRVLQTKPPSSLRIPFLPSSSWPKEPFASPRLKCKRFNFWAGFFFGDFAPLKRHKQKPVPCEGKGASFAIMRLLTMHLTWLKPSKAPFFVAIQLKGQGFLLHFFARGGGAEFLQLWPPLSGIISSIFVNYFFNPPLISSIFSPLN